MLGILACGGTATPAASTADPPVRAPEDPSAPPAATPGAPEDVTPLMAARASPTSVTTEYLDAAIAGKYEEMFALMTPACRETEKSGEKGFTRDIADGRIKLRTFELGEPEISGDTAKLAVKATFMADGAEDREGMRFELQRREPEGWMIAAIR